VRRIADGTTVPAQRGGEPADLVPVLGDEPGVDREQDKLGEAAPAHRRLGLALPVQTSDLVALAA
jgi:hypothetical protein